MKKILIRKDRNNYKGNLHCHSTNSDGHLSPSQIKELYKKNGYSFIAYTEHDLYTDLRSELNEAEFIVLPGVEASSNLIDEEKKRCIKTHHMLGILGPTHMQSKKAYGHMERLSIPMTSYVSEFEKSAQELVNELANHGLIVTYNHPVWSRVSYRQYAYLKGVWALEVYNYDTVKECAQGACFSQWDDMLIEGSDMLAIATDDNHNNGHFDDSCGGYIVVQAKELNHDEITQNMLDGNYYSSSGVEIFEYCIEDNVVSIECSDVRTINFIVHGAVGDGITVQCDDVDDTINHASYKLRGTESYIRVECIDKYGRAAWTNATRLK